MIHHQYLPPSDKPSDNATLTLTFLTRADRKRGGRISTKFYGWISIGQGTYYATFAKETDVGKFYDPSPSDPKIGR